MLRVAMIGTGYFSQFHRDAWSRCPEVEIVGIADRDLDRAQAAARELDVAHFADLPTMIGDAKPDLVDIITPPDTHRAMIECAAGAGVNIVCQKPFCGDLAQAERAVEIGERAGIDITVHENFRFMPWFSAAKREIASGRLGDIYQATFRLRPGDGQGPDAYLERQPYFQKMPRFLVHETAIHYVDVFRYLLGDVSQVSAELDRLNPAIAGEDACIITLGFSSGARGLIDGNRLADHAAQNRRRTMGELLLEGSKGTLDLDGDANLTFRAHGSNERLLVDYEWTDDSFGADCVYHFTRHLVDHYTAGTPRQNSAREYLENLRLEEAIYRADETGMRQTIAAC